MRQCELSQYRFVISKYLNSEYWGENNQKSNVNLLLKTTLLFIYFRDPAKAVELLFPFK